MRISALTTRRYGELCTLPYFVFRIAKHVTFLWRYEKWNPIVLCDDTLKTHFRGPSLLCSTSARTRNAPPATAPTTDARPWATALTSNWRRRTKWSSSTPRPRLARHSAVSELLAVFYKTVIRHSNPKLARLEISATFYGFLLQRLSRSNSPCKTTTRSPKWVRSSSLFREPTDVVQKWLLPLSKFIIKKLNIKKCRWVFDDGHMQINFYGCSFLMQMCCESPYILKIYCSSYSTNAIVTFTSSFKFVLLYQVRSRILCGVIICVDKQFCRSRGQTTELFVHTTSYPTQLHVSYLVHDLCNPLVEIVTSALEQCLDQTSDYSS